MKRKYILTALLTTTLFFTGACAEDDPNFLWLMGQGTTEGSQAAADTPVEFSLDVGDVAGDPNFVFETTQTVSVNVVVQDTSNPVAGSLVQIRETSGASAGRVRFQAVSNEQGAVTGSFTINNTTDEVSLEIVYAGQTYRFVISVRNLLAINRTILFEADALPVQAFDSDGDGVPDDADQFPDDPNRAATIRYPAEGNYTVAFEDLYPRKGDADFNDFVVQLTHQEDLDAQGRVVRIRGDYTHVAKGAGYNHTLRLNLPGVGGTYEIRRYNPAGELIDTKTGESTELLGLELMPRSNTTIASPNTRRGSAFQPGDRFEIEIIPSAPVLRADLGPAPYDLYLYVINTRKEIHFAGRYFNEDGTDRYLDSDGFPWALLIPGNWGWMYERGNIHAAYEHFESWYTSGGANNKDWYMFPDAGQVFEL